MSTEYSSSSFIFYLSDTYYKLYKQRSCVSNAVADLAGPPDSLHPYDTRPCWVSYISGERRAKFAAQSPTGNRTDIDRGQTGVWLTIHCGSQVIKDVGDFV